VSVVRFRLEHMAGKIEQRRHLKKTMIHKREQEDEDDEKKVAVPPGKQSSKPDSPIRPHALQHAHVPSTPPQASSSSSSDKPNSVDRNRVEMSVVWDERRSLARWEALRQDPESAD
jgi:hypothetical protein